MTGGAGFSRQGSDSFKQNRELRNRRGSMKDNPYSSSNKGEPLGTADYDELIKYQRIKSKRESRRKILTWTIIVVTLLVFLLIIMLTK
ncbi:MAG: hypothetical protein ACNS60_20760 [Candidatus Cyclobacteriaceae bacterium M2_1C_046]